MRILYLTASPQYVRPVPEEFTPKELEGDAKQSALREYAKLDLWPELSGVTDVLFDARSDGRVALEVVPEVRRDDLHRHLNERPITILHFSGHGEKEDTPPENKEWGSALLLKDKKIFGDYVPNEWLFNELKGKGIKIIVLNCCWSAGLAQKLLGVAECVIGTTLPLRSTAAANFSRFFYDALQKGMTLGEVRDQIETVDGVTKTTYEFVTANDDVFDHAIAPIPLDERDMSPSRRALHYYSELKELRDNNWSLVLADVVKIGFGLVVAFAFWLLFEDIASAKTCADTAGSKTFFQALACGAKMGPFAILVVVAGVTVGRIVGHLKIFFGSYPLLRFLKLIGLEPPERIERALTNTGVADLLRWARNEEAASEPAE